MKYISFVCFVLICIHHKRCLFSTGTNALTWRNRRIDHKRMKILNEIEDSKKTHGHISEVSVMETSGSWSPRHTGSAGSVVRVAEQTQVDTWAHTTRLWVYTWLHHSSMGPHTLEKFEDKNVLDIFTNHAIFNYAILLWPVNLFRLFL